MGTMRRPLLTFSSYSKAHHMPLRSQTQVLSETADLLRSQVLHCHDSNSGAARRRRGINALPITVKRLQAHTSHMQVLGIQLDSSPNAISTELKQREKWVVGFRPSWQLGWVGWADQAEAGGVGRGDQQHGQEGVTCHLLHPCPPLVSSPETLEAKVTSTPVTARERADRHCEVTPALRSPPISSPTFLSPQGLCLFFV